MIDERAEKTRQQELVADMAEVLRDLARARRAAMPDPESPLINLRPTAPYNPSWEAGIAHGLDRAAEIIEAVLPGLLREGVKP